MSRVQRVATSQRLDRILRGRKNCDVPCERSKWSTSTSTQLAPAACSPWTSSTQIAPLSFSRRSPRTCSPRISLKSQSMSRIGSPNATPIAVAYTAPTTRRESGSER